MSTVMSTVMSLGMWCSKMLPGWKSDWMIVTEVPSGERLELPAIYVRHAFLTAA
jgi:hypothetical protein